MSESARGSAPLSLTALLRVLADENVAFVVIGGIAGAVHGSPTATIDLDICYDRSQPNTRALTRALRRLNAVMYDGDQVVDREVEPRTLQHGDMFTFETSAGSLDCVACPDGTDGYEDLIRTAEMIQYAGVSVTIASLEDLMRMKFAAGRPKDLIELAILGALREELENLAGEQ
jgi:hypothetical protein